MWTLYLLYHTKANRTYLGITTDVTRRLRQHRGEIVGGARFTARVQKSFPQGHWELVATLDSFPNQSEVTRWERLLKLKTRGLKQRYEALKSLSEGKHPNSFSANMIKNYSIPNMLSFSEFYLI